MAEARVQRRLAAILAVDVVGYSRLMGEDETGTLTALKQHRSVLIDPTIAEYRGRIVKLVGDGALVEFASAVDAVECAIAIQRGMVERNAGVPDNRQIVLRIGINVGDIIIDGDDIYGDGVNVAARLEGLCGPAEIYVSAAIYDQVTGKIDATFDNIGEQTLKNIPRPVRTYRVRLKENGIPRPAAGGETDLPELPDKPSIAVMPFDCYPVDAEQEAFANGMTEDLTTDLSKVAGLFVVARNSAQAIKGQTSELRQIAKALGVRYVLEGSVRKSGERVRINAQLVDALSGGHLWADRFDGTVRDVFELQDTVGAKVVDVLAVELSQSERKSLGTVHTDNLEAYELFVRAKATPYPPIPPRIEAAREMFETVIDMAPDYAGGHAGAAAMTAFGALFSHSDPSEAAMRAQEMAQRAIDLDETFAWSYTALGMALLLQRKYDEAIAEARETIARQPNDADGYAYLGLIMGIAGDTSEGARLVEEAIRLNPRFFAGPYWNILGQVHAFAGNHAAALEALETNIRHRGPVAPPAYCSRAVAYAALGDVKKAREIIEELRSEFPQFRLSGWNLLDLVRVDEARNRYRDYAVAAGVPD
jgi:adenylate cyclase